MVWTSLSSKSLMFLSANSEKKLAAVSDEEVYIHTVWGRGYVLRDPDSDEKLASV